MRFRKTKLVKPAYAELSLGMNAKPHSEPIDDWAEDLECDVRNRTEQSAEFRSMQSLLESSAETVEIDRIVECVSAESIQMELLPPKTGWLMFQRLKAANRTSSLDREKWHRLLSCIVGRRNMKQPMIPTDIPQWATAVFKEIKLCGMPPDAFMHTCLFLAYKDNPKAVIALHKHVGRQLQQTNSSPASNVSLAKTSVVKRSLLDITYPISNKSVRALLAVMLRTANKAVLQNPEAFYQQLWEDVTASKLVLTMETYSAFLEAFAATGNKAKAERVHEFMTHRWKSSLWKPLVYRSLMHAHCAVGNWRAVVKLFHLRLKADSHRKPSSHDYKYMLKAQQGLEDPEGVLKTYRDMKRKGIVLFDDESCTSVIRAAIALKNLQIVDEIRSICLDASILQLAGAMRCAVFRELVSAYAVLGETKRLMDTVSKLKTMTNRLAIAQNASKGLPVTTADMMTLLDIRGIDLNKKLSEEARLFDFRSFKSTELSRMTISTVACYFVYKLDLDALYAFCNEHVFTQDRLGLYWSRIIVRTLTEHSSMESGALQQIERMNCGTQSTNKKVMAQYKNTLKEVSRERKNGIKLLVGDGGPLKFFYESLENAIIDKLEQIRLDQQHNSTSDDPAIWKHQEKLSSIVPNLLKQESLTVASLNIPVVLTD